MTKVLVNSTKEFVPFNQKSYFWLLFIIQKLNLEIMLLDLFKLCLL